MRQTTIPKPQEVKKQWFLIDASGVVVGKLATFTANYLRGKNKKTFTPHVDTGANVVIINAAKAVLTSNKEEKKFYHSHSGYPGGLKKISAAKLKAKRPTALVEKAVRGMLPHNKLGAKQFKNLYVYAGGEHSQQAQKPKRIEVG